MSFLSQPVLSFVSSSRRSYLKSATTTFGLLALFSCFFIAPVTLRAQQNQFSQNKTDQTSRSDIRVDPTSLGMNLQINLGGYPGRGGLDMPITLNYSSKVWSVVQLPEIDAGPGHPVIPDVSKARFAVNSIGGWTSNLGVPTIEFTGKAQSFNSLGLSCPGCSSTTYYFIPRIHVHMPGGSTVELRKSDVAIATTGEPNETDFVGTYYAVDGSRLRYETATKTLYLPDGSRYVLGDPEATLTVTETSPLTLYVDRNGNTLTYFPYTKKWRDTMNREIGLPVPFAPAKSEDIYNTNPNNPAEGNVTYTLLGVGGIPINIILRWKKLEDVRTDPNEPLRYTGSFRHAENLPSVFPSLFNGAATPYELFNPVVLSEIVLPTGQSYTFKYNVWGEIDNVKYPTGGEEHFVYGAIKSISRYGNEVNRGVIEHHIINGTEVAVWYYSAGYADANYTLPYIVNITSPNATRTERSIYTNQDPLTVECGFDNALAGMAYDERTYGTVGGVEKMFRRTLTEWALSPQSTGGWSTARRDPRVTKQVELVLDTASSSNALSKTTIYEYDEDLNVKLVSLYAYAEVNQTTAQTGAIGSIPTGNLVRKDETVYLVNDSSLNIDVRNEYRARQLIGLPTMSRVWNQSNEKVAESLISYDESGYPLLTFGQVDGWADPQTTRRANPTTVMNWLTGSTYLSTHAQFDTFGNLRKSWDAKGSLSQTDYSSAFAHAYPTQTTSPSLPGIGSLTDSTGYDLQTGLVTSATDANGQLTSFEYDDPLNRQTAIIPPSIGGRTDITYDDTPSDTISKLNVMSQTQMGSGRVRVSYQYFDALGRASRSFVNEDNNGTTTWAVSDTLYDQMGRDYQVSNPYRVTSVGGASNTPAGISTITEYDPLGRVTKVTAPGGAQATSAYAGNKVTFTDQAGKMRSSVSDAFGNPEKVIEYSVSESPFETFYKYDTLGNLCMVTQGVQKRYFKYDALNRLVRAKNPEQNANSSLSLYDSVTENDQWATSYTYEDNSNLETKTDARGITTTFAYDILNRLKTRTYSDNTPTVTYIYDTGGLSGSKAKGRLVSVSSSVSTSSFDMYDAVGQIKQSTQVTDGQTFVMHYEFDLSGNMTSQTYPSGRVVTTNLDASGRIKSVARANSVPYSNSFTYAASGAVESMRQGNGLWQHTVLNARMQPTEIGLGTTANSSNKLKLVYEYGTTNNNGNVQRQIVTVPGASGFTATHHYQYDNLNRLTAAQEINGDSSTWQASGAVWQQTFGYDRFGNRTSATASNVAGFAPAPVIVTVTNRIDSSSELFAYDDEGNLTKEPVQPGGSSPLQNYSYDAQNHLILATEGQVQLGKYIYDGAERRVKKLAGDVATIFVYNVLGQLVAEYDNSTVRPETAQTTYMSVDNLGSTRAVTNATGQVTARYDYLPFGEEIGSSVGARSSVAEYNPGSYTSKRFTGKQRDDEIGLDFFEARYYSHAQGRFTSVDPLLASANTAEPQTWNRYAYVDNNPLRFVDPDGQLKTVAGEFLFITTVGIFDLSIKTNNMNYLGRSTKYQGEIGFLVADDGRTISAFRGTGDNPNGDANCHGVTFAKGDFAIQDTGVENIIAGDSYSDIALTNLEPRVGDVAIYRENNSPTGDIVHSATVTKVKDGQVVEVAGVDRDDSNAKSSSPTKQFDNLIPVYIRSANDKRTATQRESDARNVREYNKAKARSERRKRQQSTSGQSGSRGKVEIVTYTRGGSPTPS